MGSRHAAGGADEADFVFLFEFLAFSDMDFTQMAVHGDDPFAVVNEHRAPVEEEIAGEDDRAGGGCDDRGAGGSGDVHAAVWLARFVIEKTPQSERTAGDAGTGNHEIQIGGGFGAPLRKGPARGFGFFLDPNEIFFGRIDLAFVRYCEALRGVFFRGDLEGHFFLASVGMGDVHRVVTRLGT